MQVALSPLFLGHASLVIPTPRNAMDGGLPEFVGGKVPDGGTACIRGCDAKIKQCRPQTAYVTPSNKISRKACTYTSDGGLW